MLELLRLGLLAAAILVAAPSAVVAQNNGPKLAQTLYGEGVELFKEGKFSEAADKFQQAYNIDPSPILLYNLARAAEEMGEAKAAIGHYKAYIARFPQAEDKAEVERRIRTLEAVLEAAQFGFMAIAGLPPGAEVKVNGEVMPPEGDGRWKLKPAEYDVVITAEDEPEFSTKVAIRDADTTRVEFVSSKTTDPEPGSGDGPSAMMVGGWSAVGLGIVAIGAGTFFYAQTFSNADEFDQAKKDIAQAYLDNASTDDAEARKDQAADDHSTNGTLAYVMWGVGLAAAATGTALLVLDDGDTQTAVVPTLGGLGVIGRF